MNEKKADWTSSFFVAPSDQREIWKIALSSQDDTQLNKLIESEPTGVVIYELTDFIYEQYQKANEGKEPYFNIRLKVGREIEILENIRKDLGWRQREVDIALLRELRRSTKLCLVIGAGVTMSANGPSWSKLVHELLKITQEKEHEIAVILPESEDVKGLDRYVLRNELVPPLPPNDNKKVKEIIKHIEEKGSESDVEKLMEGAQICYDLFKQQLFKHVTDILYSEADKPGSIHQAIAKVASFPRYYRPNQTYPAWAAIVNYNFDGLLCDAFEDENVPQVVLTGWAKEPIIYSKKNVVESEWVQPIYHIHGFTPNRPMDITNMDFIFSTSQYVDSYKKGESFLIDEVLKKIISRPPLISLYIGCSFNDESMNKLLKESLEKFPGRIHFALLKWPEDRKGKIPSPDEILKKSIHYLVTGVQPIWFDDYDEIPDIIESLL
jgi:hypothetical protein